MTEYEFTLKFALTNSTENPDVYIEALGRAGCDDAIIGIGQKGRLALTFNRSADDALTAVSTAIEEVKSVLPDAKLIESTPDLVGLSDIAKLVGVTRQYLRKLEITKSNFPQPVHTGTTAIWHLSTFLDWYEEASKKQIDANIKQIAAANMTINIAKEWSQLDHGTKSRLSQMAY